MISESIRPLGGRCLREGSSDWEPALAGWPLTFKVITVSANPDVARYQDRHGAMIERRQVMDRLDARLPVEDSLVTPPPHVFFVEDIGGKSGKTKEVQKHLTLERAAKARW